AMEAAGMEAPAPAQAEAKPEPMPVRNKRAIHAVPVKGKKRAAGPLGGNLAGRRGPAPDDDDKPAAKHRVARAAEKMDRKQRDLAKNELRQPRGGAFGRVRAARDDDDEAEDREAQDWAWAPVRVFPVPQYT